MTSNWRLYYKKRAKSVTFAEVREREGKTTLRTGQAFTHGEVKEIESFVVADKALVADGFRLEREWVHDRQARDYDALVQEIKAAIESDSAFAKANALALITDSDLVTISYATCSFMQIATVSDETLWGVDEWGEWGSAWQMDIAYRWLLGYGWHDKRLDDNEAMQHYKKVSCCLQDVLRSYRSSKDILLIYIGGDDLGHRWSMSLMEPELTARMKRWVGW